MDRKTFVEQCIDERQQELTHISELVWEYAEGGYQEHQSVELLCGALEKEGFTVTQNLTNIPTAFKGVWGAGKPVIGILGEYDALPGLSQQAGCTTKAPREEGARGHGCGHNMYAGEVVEYGSAAMIFKNPLHPYTQGLLNSLPRVDRDMQRLTSITGTVPSLSEMPAGCRFSNRCGQCSGQCTQQKPQLVEVEPGHQVRCLLCGAPGGRGEEAE